MKTLLKITMLALLAGILIVGCKKEQPPQPTVYANETDQSEYLAPAFTLTDQNGNTVALSDYKGKIVVLEWINPDCPFVKRHYNKGTFTGLSDKYAEKGVIWLAINTTHYFDIEKNLAFAKKTDIKYPILDDNKGTVGRLYKAKTTPQMFIIGKDGEIVYNGAIDDDAKGQKTDITNYVSQAIDQMLDGKEVIISETTPYGCTVKYAE